MAINRATLAIAALVAAVPSLRAQVPDFRAEIRPFAGAAIPTGVQRDRFDNAPLFGVQAALEIRPTLHLVSTLSWMPTQNTYVAAQDNVNIVQYNVGVELGLVRQLSGRWELRPFAGLGVGGRTYAFQSAALADRTCFAGYAALGTELQLDRTAIRFEARDNAFCYKSPVAGQTSKTRFDIGLALGLAYHLP